MRELRRWEVALGRVEKSQNIPPGWLEPLFLFSFPDQMLTNFVSEVQVQVQKELGFLLLLTTLLR